MTDFAKTVSDAINRGASVRGLACEFEVAESTVSRWAKGTARPHPRIQAQIVRFIEERRP